MRFAKFLYGFLLVVSALRCIVVAHIESLIDCSFKRCGANYESIHNASAVGSLILIGNWTVVEANTGILCACLPSMRPP